MLIWLNSMMLRLERHIILVCCGGFVNWCLFYHGARSDNFSARSNFVSSGANKARVFWLFRLLLNVNGFTTAWRSYRLLAWARLLNSNNFVAESFFVAGDELTCTLGRCTRVFAERLGESAFSAATTSLILIWKILNVSLLSQDSKQFVFLF